MNALHGEIGGAKLEEWRQFNGGAVWKVEQSTIRESAYQRRVLLHLEPGDGVVWSAVTLEDLNIQLDDAVAETFISRRAAQNGLFARVALL